MAKKPNMTLVPEELARVTKQYAEKTAAEAEKAQTAEASAEAEAAKAAKEAAAEKWARIQEDYKKPLDPHALLEVRHLYKCFWGAGRNKGLGR